MKYRGKYPNRIESTWIVTSKHLEVIKDAFPKYSTGFFCRTNTGKIYKYIGTSTKLPVNGKDEITSSDTDFLFIEQSTRRT